MAKLSEILFGNRNPRIQRASTLTGPQQQVSDQLLSALSGGQVGGPLGGAFGSLMSILGGGEGAFDEYEAPLKRQFQQEIIPGLAERFAGLGTGGSLSSSGFQQAGAQAGVDLAERLGALRANLRQGAIGQLSGLLGQGMAPQFEMFQRQPSMGLIPGLFEAGAKGLGGGLGTWLGGYFQPQSSFMQQAAPMGGMR